MAEWFKALLRKSEVAGSIPFAGKFFAIVFFLIFNKFLKILFLKQTFQNILICTKLLLTTLKMPHMTLLDLYSHIF